MPCSVRSTSAPTVRRSPNFSSCRPRQVAAVLDLDQPGERQAHELIHRFSTGRWPLWRVLGMHRDGHILYCAVEWLRSGKGAHPERYALAEVALDHVGVRWHYHASAAAAQAALQAKTETSSSA